GQGRSGRPFPWAPQSREAELGSRLHHPEHRPRGLLVITRIPRSDAANCHALTMSCSDSVSPVEAFTARTERIPCTRRSHSGHAGTDSDHVGPDERSRLSFQRLLISVDGVLAVEHLEMAPWQ